MGIIFFDDMINIRHFGWDKSGQLKSQQIRIGYVMLKDLATQHLIV